MGGRGEIECRPIAEAVEASGESFGDIARRMDWYIRCHSHGKVYVRVDVVRVGRRLGRLAYHSNGRKRYQKHMDYDTAVRICAAANIDPVDVGL